MITKCPLVNTTYVYMALLKARLAHGLILRQQLNNLRKEPKEEITQYIARAKEIASNLDSIGLRTEPAELALPIMAMGNGSKVVQCAGHLCGSLQARVHP